VGVARGVGLGGIFAATDTFESGLFNINKFTHNHPFFPPDWVERMI
jgi:hypothetical protein